MNDKKTGGRVWRRLTPLVLFALVLTPALAPAQTFKTVAGQQQLYSGPSYSSSILGVVPAGGEVAVLEESGEWVQVEHQGQRGWLPSRAFPTSKKLDLSKLLQGRAVQERSTDEVALASKGFTPEVEADFRRQHPELKYDQVDRLEQFTVSQADLQAFRQAGGLR